MDAPVHINSTAQLADVFGFDAESPTLETIRLFFASGGTHAVVVRSGDGASAQTIAGEPHRFRGVWSLIDEPFGMLCIPATRSMSLDDADLVVRAALEVTENHQALYLLDPPAELGLDPASYDEWLPVHPNAASFLPHLALQDPDGYDINELPISGSVAGAFASTPGVWNGPETLAQLPENSRWAITETYGPDAQFEFERSGVNLCGPDGRPLNPTTHTLMARGAISPDEADIVVARTATMVRASIAERIDNSLRALDADACAQLTEQIDDFLRDLWQRSAFVEASPDDASFVRTDADAGLITVGFAPYRPGEFVEVSIPARILTDAAVHLVTA